MNREKVIFVEAGALAHDLGNLHLDMQEKKFLNEIFSDIGGFEGNAQTLRILTSIEKKRPDFRGLNLTYRSMLSVVKYFNIIYSKNSPSSIGWEMNCKKTKKNTCSATRFMV